DFPHEMKDQVAYGSGHKRREEYADSDSIMFKTPKEGREKKANYEQFLEIVIVAIPEVGESLRRQWSVRVPEQPIASHATTGHHRVTPNSYVKHVMKKAVRERGPTHSQRVGMCSDLSSKGLVEL